MVNELYDDNLVSVIIPVYNKSMYVSESIESVLAQTYKNIEIIVVDDKSSDHSLDILKSYTDQYENIKLIEMKYNVGVAIARNEALFFARGRYVAFLDADDLWHPKKVETQMKYLEYPNVSFCFTAINMITPEGIILKRKRKIKNVVNYKFLLRNTMIATSSVMIDRKKTGTFYMPMLRSGQDYATWLMLLRKGNVAHGIDNALVKYRITENSLSSNKTKNIRKVWNVQVNYEGISKLDASVNSLFYVLNAVVKYYF